MKNTGMVAAFFVCLCVLPDKAVPATDWVVEILPASVVAHFGAADFSVQGPNGKETMSRISSLPMTTVGRTIELGPAYLDLKVGAGMLLNSQLGSGMVCGTAGYYWEIKPSILVGPHLCVSHFPNPEWWGDTEMEIDRSTGFLLGVHLSAGDRISYLLSVDYMSASFGVSAPTPATIPSDSELDMSGIMIQFGIRAQF